MLLFRATTRRRDVGCFRRVVAPLRETNLYLTPRRGGATLDVFVAPSRRSAKQQLIALNCPSVF